MSAPPWSRPAGSPCGFFRRQHESWHKGPGQIVTEADIAIDRFLHAELRRDHATDGWLSEETEDDRVRLERRRVWVVDPIDGTRSFAEGVAEFTICVGLLEDGEPRAGLCPQSRHRASCSRPASAMAPSSTAPGLQASPARDLAGARIVASKFESRRRGFAALVPTAELSSLGSLAYKLALVAAGRFDGYLSWRRTHDWDIAAAVLLLTEAGAVMTDAAGGPIRLNRPDPTHQGLLAAGAALHPRLLAATTRRRTRPTSPTAAPAACRSEAAALLARRTLLAARAGRSTAASQRVETTMPTIPSARLFDLVTLTARAMGSSEAEARDVAEHLVAANLAGHDSHGVGMLPDYVRMLHAGLLVPNQTLELVADRGGVLVLDARRGFGQAMAKEAMRRGIERARQQGSVAVALRNSAHIGRIGHWAEQCAAAGMVSVHFVNVGDHGPLQAPYGCSDARLGTNPFAAGVPGAGRRGGAGARHGDQRHRLRQGAGRAQQGRAGARGRADRRAGPADHRPHHLCRRAARRPARVRRPQGLGPGHPVRGAGRRGHRRHDHRAAPPAPGRHRQQHAVVHPRRRRARRPGRHRARDGGGRRLGQGLAAGTRLRRGAAAGRARAPRKAAPRWAEGVPIDDKSLADILEAARSLGLTDAELDRRAGPLSRSMERVDCVVVGAGVVGLACARRLAMAGLEVIVLERADAIGTETSSRNSEVIHAGIYYAAGSLKARLCIAGKQFLYRYCAERGVAHARCGKLIVATSDAQLRDAGDDPGQRAGTGHARPGALARRARDGARAGAVLHRAPCGRRPPVSSTATG